MNLFGIKKVSKGTIEEVSSMIESYFASRNLLAKDHVLDSSDGCGWWVKQGTATVYIFVQETANGSVIRITSPLVKIPQTNREDFYRKLLDINSDLSACALSTHDEVVLVVTQRHTTGLDQEELDEIVWNVAYVADLLDEKLCREFGAEMYQTA